MRIQVIAYAGEAKDTDFTGKNVVVIDVLRATSVVVTAIQNGAKSVIPVASVEDAKRIYSEAGDGGNILLCGERNAETIPGFHLGNSPLEYTPDVVKTKNLILTTTNGTRAIQNINRASAIYIGAFLNASAIAKQIISEGKDICLVCAGTNNQFSMDDGLCAGMIISLVQQRVPCECTDLASLLCEHYLAHRENIESALHACTHYHVLMKKGWKEDIAFCLKNNVFEIVPVFKNGEIIM